MAGSGGRIRVLQGGETVRVEDAPQRVGDIVGQHAEEESPVVDEGPPARLLFAAPQYVTVDDEQNDGRQNADDRISHALCLSSPAQSDIPLSAAPMPRCPHGESLYGYYTVPG